MTTRPTLLHSTAAALAAITLALTCFGCGSPRGPACELTETTCADLCVDAQSSTDHCGGCDLACEPEPNEVPACVDAVCEFACAAGYADCDATAAGCETDVTDSVAHCGACNAACDSANVSNACVASQCVVGACDTGFADVDGLPDCEQAFTSVETLRSLSVDVESASLNVFVDAAGNRYMGWRDYDGAGLVLRYSAYDATNGTWSTPIGIQDHDAGDGPSFVEGAGGEVIALWRERNLANTTESYYFAARVHPDGTADAAIEVAGPAAISSGRLVFDDSGMATAAWVEDGAVRYATLAPGAQAFQQQGLLLGPGDQDVNLVLYPAAVGATVVFSRRDGGERPLDLLRYDTEASRYYVAERLFPATAGVVPTLVGLTALPNGREVLVLRRTSSATFETSYWLQSRASGGAWSDPAPIDAGHDIAAITFRETASGDLRLAFQRRDEVAGTKQLVTALLDATTGALGALVANPETYDASSINGWALTSEPNGDLFVAWLSKENDAHRVRFARFFASDQRWGSSSIGEDAARVASVSQIRLVENSAGEHVLYYVRPRPSASVTANTSVYEVTLPH
ncbi:MAG: hypothetical protein KC593_10665 [Myxococcales bacterium]|nr:hypothetical protein [Myxococcales bacterium]